MPQLQRRASRLLRTVGGKSHASSDDHETDTHSAKETGISGGAKTETRDMQVEMRSKEDDEAAVFADPISSDDEDAAPSPVKKEAIPAKQTTALENKKAIGTTKSANSSQGRQSARKTIQPPRRGAYQANQVDKARQVGEAEKENASLSVAEAKAQKRSLDDDGAGDKDGIFDSFLYQPAKKQRIMNAKSTYTGNIHAKANTYGAKKGAQGSCGYGARKAAATNDLEARKTQEEAIEGLIADVKRKEQERDAKAKLGENDDDDLSDVSMKELPTKPSTHSRGKHSPNKKTAATTPKSPKKNAAAGLRELLDKYVGNPLFAALAPAPRSPLRSTDLNPLVSGTSTPLSSVPSLIGELVSADTSTADIMTNAADKCPLCEAPVDPTHLEAFFANKPRRTVRQQQLFCHEHVRRSALEQYKKKAYPQIDWPLLPSRIACQESYLRQVLRGEVKSRFRDSEWQGEMGNPKPTSTSASPRKSSKLKSGSRAEMGKATRRQKGIEIMATNTSLSSQTTAYYGPRGARCMLETITKLLSSDLRKAETSDPLLIDIGLANFVLRVLVPECTIRLVMEDYSGGDGDEERVGISEGVAAEIVKESGEVGNVVHPEVEDLVEVGLVGDEENDRDLVELVRDDEDDLVEVVRDGEDDLIELVGDEEDVVEGKRAFERLIASVKY